MKNELQDLYNIIDSHGDFHCFNIIDYINQLIKDNQDVYDEFWFKIEAERIIFSLYQNLWSETSWGISYWPLYRQTDKNGDLVWEYPSKESITIEVIEYWKYRALHTKNLLIKFRYLDVIYDCAKNFTWKDIDFSLKKELIETWLKIIIERKVDGIHWKKLLTRLVDIVISLNQKEYLKQLEWIIIDYEQEIFELNSPWLWWFSYDLLIKNKKARKNIDYINELKIISFLEEALNQADTFYLLENVCERLAEYYNIKNSEEDILWVLWKMKNLFYENVKNNGRNLLLSWDFDKIMNFYKKYQHYKSIKNVRDEIINFFQNQPEKIKDEMQTIKTPFSISDKEMEDYVACFFKNSEIKILIGNIGAHFLPKKKEIQKQLQESIKNHPILYLCTSRYIDKNGFTVSTWNNENLHLYKQALLNISVSNIFMEQVLEKFIQTTTLDSLMEEFRKESIYSNKELLLLEKILKKYYEKDYLSFSALAIPFIESSFRLLAGWMWKTIINYKDGQLEYLSLDSLLSSWILQEIFKERWEDMEFYLKTLLTKEEWWNLRNRFAHGLDFFETRDISDRLFHVLLFFSMIKVKNKE